MQVDDNKRVLQAFVRDVLDAKNLGAANKYLAPNFFHHDLAPGEQTGNQTGIEGIKRFFASTVFPGLSEFQTSFGDMIGEKDLVAGRWTQSVRQTGVWLGRQPSGRRASVGGISIVRVRDNMIVEEWEARDTAALLTAFGVMPPPRPLEPSNLSAAELARATAPARATPVRVLTGGAFAVFAPAASAALATAAPAAAPSLDRAKALAGSFVTDVWNRQQIDQVDKLFSPQFVHRNALNGQAAGRDGVKQFVDRFSSAFPDATVRADIILAEGDKVVARWSAHGTHKGTFLGNPATGRVVSLAGIDIHRVQGDQIAESWGFWPVAETLQQIGAQKGP